MRGAFAALALCASCGGAEISPAPLCPGEPVVLDSASLLRYDGEPMDCARIPADAVIEVPTGGTHVLRARTWIIDGPARFVSAPTAPRLLPPWTSSGPFCAVAHTDWMRAANTRTDERGADGVPGAILELHYTSVVGGVGRLALLNATLAGAPGEPGRELRCGCTDPTHADHVVQGPSGAPGPAGFLRLIEEAP